MNVGAAFAALFIAGAGQVVRGRLRRAGIVAAVETALWLALALTMFRSPLATPVAVTLVLVRLAATVDAARGSDGPRRLSSGATAALVCALGVLAFSGMLSMRRFVVEAFKIASGAMIPTLQVGDHIYVDKRVHDARRGDVIVFKYPRDTRMDFIERVIGVAGDTIELNGTDVILNGATVAHRAADEPCSYDDVDNDGAWKNATPCHAVDETIDGRTHRVIYTHETEPQGPFTVGAGELFVIGDNRDNSYDSRSWGNVPVANLRGRAVMVWWSEGPNGARIERLGTEIK